MTTALLVPALVKAGTDHEGHLAAIVLLLDGQREEWRDAALADDPDVTSWLARALTPCHPDYASLWWVDLERLRTV